MPVPLLLRDTRMVRSKLKRTNHGPVGRTKGESLGLAHEAPRFREAALELGGGHLAPISRAIQIKSSAIGPRNGLGQMRLASESARAITTKMKNGVSIRKMGGGGLIAFGGGFGCWRHLLLELHDSTSHTAGQERGQQDGREEAQEFHLRLLHSSNSRGIIGSGATCSCRLKAIA